MFNQSIPSKQVKEVLLSSGIETITRGNSFIILADINDRLPILSLLSVTKEELLLLGRVVFVYSV